LLSGLSRFVVRRCCWFPALLLRFRPACCALRRRCARRCLRCSLPSGLASGRRRSLRLACRRRRWWCASRWAVRGRFAWRSPGFCGFSHAVPSLLPFSLPPSGSRRCGVLRWASPLSSVSPAGLWRRFVAACVRPSRHGRLCGWR
jgi:hypothetical protein